MGKFDEKADEGIFLGYAAKNKGCRVFNKRTMIIEESINVTFDEQNQMTIDDDDEDLNVCNSAPSSTASSTTPADPPGEDPGTSYHQSPPKRLKFTAIIQRI